MNIFTLAKKGKQSAHGFFLPFFCQASHMSDSILQGYVSNLKRISNISLVFLT